jgi:hypothetical protein
MTLLIPTKIIFGNGAISEIGKEASQFGKKALIVTYPDIRRIGLLDKIIQALKTSNVEAVPFEEVEPNPRTTTVDKGAAAFRNEKCDLIIGIGGGSAMDCAKGIMATVASIGTAWDVLQRKVQPAAPFAPIIQIPTMAGTGSEINATSVLTHWETHYKGVLVHPATQAKTAIIDPQLTLTVPKNQTKAGGVDTFCHIVEAYLTDNTPQPLTDDIRESVMRVVVNNLSKAIAKPDDLDARYQLSWASTVSMSTLHRIGGGSGQLTLHGIEHALSGFYDVTHGAGLAALLPAWMRFTLKDKPERFEKLARMVFSSKQDGVTATVEWLDSVGMKLRLRDLGCKIEDADEIGRLTMLMSAWVRMHPTPIDEKVVAQIFRDAF